MYTSKWFKKFIQKVFRNELLVVVGGRLMIECATGASVLLRLDDGQIFELNLSLAKLIYRVFIYKILIFQFSFRT